MRSQVQHLLESLIVSSTTFFFETPKDRPEPSHIHVSLFGNLVTRQAWTTCETRHFTPSQLMASHRHFDQTHGPVPRRLRSCNIVQNSARGLSDQRRMASDNCQLLCREVRIRQRIGSAPMPSPTLTDRTPSDAYQDSERVPLAELFFCF